ncbi:MAG: DUF433 domain-containing protein [Planctomycetes bacterium]|nr:DUF433 domain-containing protein [Planctomycetota bacterium]
MRKRLGRYIVVDSDICHGQPTFRGTRVLVHDVLEQVAQGLPWETISEQWRGAVRRPAIAEAVRLAGKALEVVASNAFKIPLELREELAAWQRASANSLALVEHLIRTS